MREDIYKAIKARIINLDYKPNECLTENKVAKEFNVSRTPIREIFIQLSCENLVTITPNNSIRISDINLQGLQELIGFRVVLEKGAASLLIQNVTEEDLELLVQLKNEINAIRDKCSAGDLMDLDTRFHQIIRNATRNNLLIKNLEAVQLQFTRIQKMIGHKPDRMEFHLDTIIESIKKKDVARIENVLTDHVYNFVSTIKSYFKMI